MGPPSEDRKRAGAGAPSIALIVVAILGFAASVITNWPGHFPPDALSQLAQGRAGVFNGWHPPVMAWLLGVADRIIPGAPLFIVLQAGLCFASLAAFALVKRPGWSAVALMAVLAASPLVLIYQGLVVKDVLFADASLAGFAAIAWTARVWDRPGARFAAIALTLGFLTLAALARQNGAIVAVGGAITLAAVAGTRTRRRRPGGARLYAIGACAALAVMAAAGGLAIAAFTAHSDGAPEGARQQAAIAIYDLAGVARRDPAIALPLLHRSDPALEIFIRRDAAAAYTPTRIDTLAPLPAWNGVMRAPDPWAAAQWRALLTASPGLYLAVRAEVFRQMFLTPDVQACDPVLVGVDGGIPSLLTAAGMTARDTDKDDWDGDYATRFLGTPVFSHLAYALLALALLVLAVRDVRRGGQPEMIAQIGLLASALAFTASFFVIAIACDYRYLYFLDAAAMAALVQRAAYWP
jgi:hypothetical protein